MLTRFAAALAIFAIGQFAGLYAAVASPETSARVDRMDRAFREVSVTTFEGVVEGVWENFLIRGRSIALDDENATLHVKYSRCKALSINGLRSERDNPLTSSNFECEGEHWKSEAAQKEAKYALVNIELPSIVVSEKSGPQKRGPYSAKWFEIEFTYIGENGFAVVGTSIECPSQLTCEAMAADLRPLVKAVQTMRDAITRVGENYRGIVFQNSSEGHTLVAKADLIDAGLARLRTRQQVCLRSQEQDCDRDKLWRERVAVADITKLASAVEIDEVRAVSDDKTIGIVTVNCGDGGCWGERIGGEGGKITGGRQHEQIFCKIGDGCHQMKRDLEQLITLATAKDAPVPKGEAPAGNAAPPDELWKLLGTPLLPREK
jgi:hypothetical protein